MNCNKITLTHAESITPLITTAEQDTEPKISSYIKFHVATKKKLSDGIKVAINTTPSSIYHNLDSKVNGYINVHTQKKNWFWMVGKKQAILPEAHIIPEPIFSDFQWIQIIFEA